MYIHLNKEKIHTIGKKAVGEFLLVIKWFKYNSYHYHSINNSDKYKIFKKKNNNNNKL